VISRYISLAHKHSVTINSDQIRTVSASKNRKTWILLQRVLS